MSELKFETIVSSNLDSAAYDAENGTIIVRLKNGSAYAYADCGEELWNDFKATFDGKDGRSAGKFFHAQVKALPYEKLDAWK